MAVTQIGSLNTFSSGQTISSSSVNSNFSSIKTAFNNLVPSLNTINVNTISEVTAANGVVVDGVTLKDSDVTCVDLTVSGTATISGLSVAASSVTAGTFGTGAYTFDDDLDVDGDLIPNQAIVLASQSIRVQDAASPSASFGLSSCSVGSGGGASNTVATGSDQKAFLVVGGQLAGLFAWSTGTTLINIASAANMVSGSPGASQVGITIASSGVVTITHGSSVTNAEVYGIYIFRGGS